MEKFKEPLPPYRFLVDSFFRLHRRRQLSQHGFQPIPYQEMADFAERVLNLQPRLLSLFYRTIEATDNAVMYDHYQKGKSEADALKADMEATKGSRKGRGARK